MNMEKLFRLFNLHAAVSAHHAKFRIGFRCTGTEYEHAENVTSARDSLASELGINPDQLCSYTISDFPEYEPKD